MADKTLNRSNGSLDDATWPHKWGFRDTRFIVNPDRSVTMTGSRYALSGKELPEFLHFAESVLGVKIDLNDVKVEQTNKPVPPPVNNGPFLRALADAFPADQYSQAQQARLLHSHGQTTVDEVYKVLYGTLDRVADLVFYLHSEEDAATLIALAAEHDICLVPFGGGTSVSGALKLPADETRMIVAVDTRRLNRILWIDAENLRACAQAGITGRELEMALNREGYTCGHEPDSMELSTLGGWIATNASGMKKNRYGNIENLVENVTLVTPRGVVEQLQTQPRISVGMQLQQLAFGSEGMLGLITKAVFRIFKLPAVKKYGSIVFPDFKTGADYLYALNQTGVLPASIRLLDNIQFRFGSALKPRPTPADRLINEVQKAFLLRIKQFDPEQLCAATIVMEGTAAEVAYQEKVIFDLAKQFKGISGGEGNGQRGYMLTYAIAYIRDFLADFHIIGETYETTVPWSKIHAVCNAVAQRADELHRAYGLPGRPYVSPRITQIYHTGVCIYFTHGFSIKGVERPDEVFAAIERDLRRTIMDNGGSISHHHGVGKLRQPFLDRAISPATVEILRDIKALHDPDNIFGIRNSVVMGEGEQQTA